MRAPTLFKDYSLSDFRCQNCRKLLAKMWLDRAVVEIKCPRCNTMNTRSELPEPKEDQ